MVRWVLPSLAMLAILAVTVPAQGAKRSALAGTWSGTMRPAGDGVKRAYGFRLRIDADGRRGTWRTERCRGTLRFLRRSDGYSLFRETRTSGPCTGKGVDWVKRRGSRLYVSFKSASGPRFNSRGTLARR